MAAQWEAAKAGLRVFLEEDGGYVHFLASVEQDLARKLRFQCQSQSGSLLESIIFDRFVETIAQLLCFHVFFQTKLKAVVETPACGDVRLIEGECSNFVDILADMLSILRVLYGQLICRSEVTQATLEAVLSKEEKECDGVVLENYLEKQQLSVEKLVSRPLKRFDELVEFVEALSKTLSEDDRDDIVGAEAEEKLNFAPQLLHIVQENKHYVHLNKAEKREEEKLIALQTRFTGDGANTFCDLSTNKLLLHGEVLLSVRAPQDSEPGLSFRILHCLHLKQDAAFLECIPASVPVSKSSEEAHALALLLRDTTLVFAWTDQTENDTVPTQFASFYDDHLPGVFWMAPDEEVNTNRDQWELVEIVFYARWLLVFKLEGWKHHSSVGHFDTHAPEIEVSEQPRGDKEWSLVVSNGTAGSITLVSKKRTRIDFWFDQVWKTVETAQSAARRVEREKRERQEMEEEEVHVRANSKSERAGKKRKLLSNGDSPTMLEENMKLSSSVSPASSGDFKPDDKTDEEGGEQDRSTTSINTEKDPSAAPPVTKKSRCSSKAKEAPAEDIASPAVKTPKRRWLKRKSEDPNDSALISTQPSPSIPTDESTSEVDVTQLPANEAAAEAELKSQEVRIILTGLEPTAAIRKKIDSIPGAVYEEDIEKATHILAPKNQLKRTVKLLCGISRCAHVLDVRWLDESARVGAPVYERAHCLKDARAEAKWQFDLRKTMYDFTLKQRQQLFAGHQVFITNHKSVLPPMKDLAKIVEYAGGMAVTKGSAGPNDLVITSEVALATASIRKALAQANPQQIYSAELILSGILQQHIDFDKNRLEQPSGTSRRRR
ncbi:Hypothetical protein PHPALM_37480 [Phytophthora palmivora]|uniref:BRCT domain-containing protein n=1 Tax=Phytophthora palmivora TaxID=4796 RepID=A0A2P4WXA8_9STRA|nr:Hypothetical protein PHPALM_37480 [Phytophthora palmivora]